MVGRFLEMGIELQVMSKGGILFPNFHMYIECFARAGTFLAHKIGRAHV